MKPPTILAIAFLCASTISELHANTIVFTEYSSSLLTATVDGNPYGGVYCTEPGIWIWRPPSTPTPWGVTVTLQPTAWLEPLSLPGAPTVNLVSAKKTDPSFYGDAVEIRSGLPQPNQAPLLTDGTILTAGLGLDFVNNYKWGNPDPWSATYNIQYVDLTTRVPDTTPTFLLMIMAGWVLIAARTTQAARSTTPTAKV